jgi:uncharacterized Zn finger protein (UPF0148 family)
MLVSICPHCKIRVPFVNEYDGKEVFCPGCGRHFALRLAHPSLAASPDKAAEPLILPLEDATTSEVPPSTTSNHCGLPKQSQMTAGSSDLPIQSN